MVARREPPTPSEMVVAETDQPEPVRPREKIGQLAKAARKLAARLSPVAKAEAAPVARQLRAPGETDRWSIELGAFRVESAAEQAARSAGTVPGTRGKPVQIVQPSKGGKERFYRARLLNFSPQEAQGACAALRKKKIECAALPPPPVKIATR
jgi:SPOR domain